MPSKPFPVDGGSVSFWRSEPDVLDSHRTTPELPKQADVVVIGSGYAGASTAFHILNGQEASARHSLVVLEARQACSGATGRNGGHFTILYDTNLFVVYQSTHFLLGGHLRPDLHDSIHSFAQKYGIEPAAEIASFEVAHVEAVKRFIEEEQLSCDFELSEALDVQLNNSDAKRLQENVKGLIQAGSKTASHLQVSTHETAEDVSLICLNNRKESAELIEHFSFLSRTLASKGRRAVSNTQPLACGHTNSSPIY